MFISIFLTTANIILESRIRWAAAVGWLRVMQVERIWAAAMAGVTSAVLKRAAQAVRRNTGKQFTYSRFAPCWSLRPNASHKRLGTCCHRHLVYWFKSLSFYINDYRSLKLVFFTTTHFTRPSRPYTRKKIATFWRTMKNTKQIKTIP